MELIRFEFTFFSNSGKSNSHADTHSIIYLRYIWPLPVRLDEEIQKFKTLGKSRINISSVCMYSDI